MIHADAAMDYLEFVVERHKVWELRQAGAPGPWTTHPVLATKKFTNVFRVLDWGSQFLLKELLDPDLSPRDTLMRCFLYRHTGRWEAWEFFDLMHGRMPLVEDLYDGTVLEAFKQYRGAGKSASRAGAKNPKGGMTKDFQRPMFTNAYLVFPQSATPGTDKLESIVDLTRRLFHPGGPGDIVPAFYAAKSPAAQFQILVSNKGVGDFMSMQVLTDWGYSTQCGEDREDTFVVCGPGAVKGAAALGTGNAQVVHRWAVDAVRSLPDCPQLEGKPPSWMDVQNCLCEFSKYVRYAERVTPTLPYAPAHPGPQPLPTLPGHW